MPNRWRMETVPFAKEHQPSADDLGGHDRGQHSSSPGPRCRVHRRAGAHRQPGRRYHDRLPECPRCHPGQVRVPRRRSSQPEHAPRRRLPLPVGYAWTQAMSELAEAADLTGDAGGRRPRPLRVQLLFGLARRAGNHRGSTDRPSARPGCARDRRRDTRARRTHRAPWRPADATGRPPSSPVTWCSWPNPGAGAAHHPARCGRSCAKRSTSPSHSASESSPSTSNGTDSRAERIRTAIRGKHGWRAAALGGC